MSFPLNVYDRMVRTGTLVSDPAQRQAAEALDKLAHTLNRYQPGKRGLFRRTMAPPMGLYLWGGVGAGKSLLMDIFYETITIQRKRRVHFHAFMQETHRFIAAWRGMNDRTRRAHPARYNGASLDDPIPHAAKAIFDASWLLCFDEFQVTDITDAMLLGRLFEHLFEMGAVIVATSNRHPDDLYKDGLNRQLFLPSIELLKTRIHVHEVKSQKDYRLDQLEGEQVYFTPLGQEATASLNKIFTRMAAGAQPYREEIDVGNRLIVVPYAARDLARGHFTHWSSDAFGPGDYLTVASRFPVVFIDDIPQLGPENRNEAKRFVTFIDALYEANCMLICSAAADPDALYPAGDGVFEFARTASRLHEMRSHDYLCREHIGTHEQAAE